MDYDDKFKEILDKYFGINVAPDRNYSKDEMVDMYTELKDKYGIKDEYDFMYLMSLFFCKINGNNDDHTYLSIYGLEKVNGKFYSLTVPIWFRKFGDSFYVTRCDDKKLVGKTLTGVNGIKIDNLLKEIEPASTEGLYGRREFIINRYLTEFHRLRSLPSIDSKTSKIQYDLLDSNNSIVKSKVYDSNIHNFEFVTTRFRKPRVNTNGKTIIFEYHSCDKRLKDDIIKASLDIASMIKSGNYDNLIVDLRDNTGGNSSFSDAMIDALKDSDMNIIVLTNRYVFSAARHILNKLTYLGAYTIGEKDIATPLSCFGENPTSIRASQNSFIQFSSTYFFMDYNYAGSARSKKEYDELDDKYKDPNYFHPNLIIEDSIDNYIGEDRFMNEAYRYIENKRLKKKH